MHCLPSAIPDAQLRMSSNVLLNKPRKETMWKRPFLSSGIKIKLSNPLERKSTNIQQLSCITALSAIIATVKHRDVSFSSYRQCPKWLPLTCTCWQTTASKELKPGSYDMLEQRRDPPAALKFCHVYSLVNSLTTSWEILSQSLRHASPIFVF